MGFPISSTGFRGLSAAFGSLLRNGTPRTDNAWSTTLSFCDHFSGEQLRQAEHIDRVASLRSLKESFNNSFQRLRPCGRTADFKCWLQLCGVS